MKISYNWLRNYLDIDETPEDIAKMLTSCGLEVDGIKKIESIKGGLSGIVVGEVMTCQKHPDADKLTLTTVNIGQRVLQIVCGAPNVAKGQKVLVAIPGTTLYPISGDPFEIKMAKIRGQISEGMICAEDEAGLGTDHKGIMILDPEAEPGTTAREYFNTTEDYCIEIGLTPNRVDAASHIGVARDLVALKNIANPENPIQLKLPDVEKFKPDQRTSKIEIEIHDPEACPRYSGVCISGVKVGDSPQWLKDLLRIIDLKSINNIVDITNFVLHETGQPLHAFDAKTIKGGKVIISKPPKGTTFITLDKVEIELGGDDLMICNSEEPMCLGGIVGGVHSGVKSSTTEIFLESAYFNPVTIRKSSRNHGIKTDASFRFERGADPEMTLYALKRAAILIKEIAGGQISSDIIDHYPVPQIPAKVKFNYQAADSLIGKSIDRDVIKKILQSLHIKISEQNEQGLLLEIPPFKVDVTRQADVVEEILRIYGYNNIELPQHMTSSVVTNPVPDKELLQNIASDFLSSRGFVEIINNSLTKATYYTSKTFDPSSIVQVVNPLSQDLGVMRQTLFFGGMEVLEWNQNRKQDNIKVYEFGNVYFKVPSTGTSLPTQLDGYLEKRMLAILMTGNTANETWYQPNKPVSLFELKAEILSLIKRMNVNLSDLTPLEVSNSSYFSTGVSYSLNGKVLSTIGEVNQSYRDQFDLKQGVFYGEIEWDYLITLNQEKEIRFREIPRFPEVRRDLSLLIDNKVRFADIEKAVLLQEPKLLKKVKLFDVYRGNKIEGEMKSYAIRFTIQDENKTLTDAEIDKVMSKISKALQKQFNATIR